MSQALQCHRARLFTHRVTLHDRQHLDLMANIRCHSSIIGPSNPNLIPLSVMCEDHRHHSSNHPPHASGTTASMNAALEHPGLGTLGKLPREIRDMIYAFLAVDIQKASRMNGDKSKAVYAVYLLANLKSRVEKSTSKQLYVEFLEVVVRISTIKHDLDSPRERCFEELLQYLDDYLGPDLEFNSIGLHFRHFRPYANRYDLRGNRSSSYNYSLDTTRQRFEEAWKTLYHCHVQHNIPAHKIFLECIVAFRLPHVGCFVDLHRLYKFNAPVKFVLSMADPDASAQSFTNAINRAKQTVNRKLSDPSTTDRFLEFATNQKEEIQVFDRFYKSMIDWAFDYWKTKDDELRNKKRLKLEESLAAQEDGNALDTHQDRLVSLTSSLDHTTSHGSSSLTSNLAPDLEEK